MSYINYGDIHSNVGGLKPINGLRQSEYDRAVKFYRYTTIFQRRYNVRIDCLGRVTMSLSKEGLRAVSHSRDFRPYHPDLPVDIHRNEPYNPQKGVGKVSGMDPRSFRWVTFLTLGTIGLVAIGACISMIVAPPSYVSTEFTEFGEGSAEPMEVAVLQSKDESSLYNTHAILTDIIGQHVSITIFTGRVLLIVNVASECGYTDSNYAVFAELLDRYHEKGLDILVFPCNEFGNQEPGTNEDIRQFILDHSKPVPFMMSKMIHSIQGNDLFTWLRTNMPPDDPLGNGPITWNFNKFLVNRDGKVVRRYSSDAQLERLDEDILVELSPL